MSNTLNKLSKISRYAEMITIAMMVLLVIGITALLVLGAAVILNPSLLAEMASGDLSDGQIRTVLVTAVCALILGFVTLYYIYRLFKSIHVNNTPFMDESVKCLERIAIMVIICTIVLPIITYAAVHLLNGSQEQVFEFNPFSLFIAFMFYFLSLIFKYGVALQKESDATL